MELYPSLRVYRGNISRRVTGMCVLTGMGSLCLFSGHLRSGRVVLLWVRGWSGTKWVGTASGGGFF